jgi:hypothetical protein
MGKMDGKGTEEFQKLEEEYIDFVFGDMQCMECEHALDGRSCKAFNWIPDDILLGIHDHRNPYPGDNGVRFKQKVEVRK